MPENKLIQLHRAIAVIGIILIITFTVLGIYQAQYFTNKNSPWNFSGAAFYLSAFCCAVYFLLNIGWSNSRFKKEYFGGFLLVALAAAVYLVFRVIELSERSENNNLVTNFLNTLTETVFSAKRRAPLWLVQCIDVLSVALPALIVICFGLLWWIQQQIHTALPPTETPVSNSRFIRLHRVCCIAGLLFLSAFMISGYYSETQYTQGFNLHIFRSWQIWVYSMIPFLYFIFNLRWYTSRIQKELTGAFFVVAVLFLAIGIGLLVSIAREMFRAPSGPQLFDGLFKSDNPPPCWLDLLNYTSFTIFVLLVVICFLVLWRIRKNRAGELKAAH